MVFNPISQYEQYKKLTPRINEFVKATISNYPTTDFSYLELCKLYMWSKGLKSQENQAEYQYLYHFYQLQKYGEKIFYVTKNMTELLSCTNVNVHGDLIQTPFQSLFLQLEDSGITIIDMRGHTAPLKGIYLNMRNDDERMLRIMLVSDIFDDINIWSKIPLYEARSDVLLENHLTVALNDLPSGPYQKLYAEMLQKVYRLVINTLLYITSHKPDIKNVTPVISTSKKAKVLRRLDKSASLPFIVLGSSLPRMQGLKEGSTYQISERFIVRGHWRAQWRGSRKDNSWHQDVIWIKPFVKGDDLADGINRKYKI